MADGVLYRVVCGCYFCWHQLEFYRVVRVYPCAASLMQGTGMRRSFRLGPSVRLISLGYSQGVRLLSVCELEQQDYHVWCPGDAPGHLPGRCALAARALSASAHSCCGLLLVW